MNPDRYRRQMLVKEIGQKGQEILLKKHAVIIGGGGLGSNSANLLVRMGVGRVDIIDFDVVDITNLHRTSLFSENDIGKFKAVILQQRLQEINSNVHVKGINQKVSLDNIEYLVHDADIIIDGTDSIQLRILINQISLTHNIPWVYAGVNETIGMVMGIVPKKTPCFQCITQNIPDSNAMEIPVLGSLPATIASIQCNEAIKMLLGIQPKGLLIYDVWNQSFETINIERNSDCPTCSTKTMN